MKITILILASFLMVGELQSAQHVQSVEEIKKALEENKKLFQIRRNTLQQESHLTDAEKAYALLMLGADEQDEELDLQYQLNVAYNRQLLRTRNSNRSLFRMGIAREDDFADRASMPQAQGVQVPVRTVISEPLPQRPAPRRSIPGENPYATLEDMKWHKYQFRLKAQQEAEEAAKKTAQDDAMRRIQSEPLKSSRQRAQTSISVPESQSQESSKLEKKSEKKTTWL